MSMNGATVVNGAISSAALTIASVGTGMLAGPNRPVADRQGPVTEAVLAIKPLDNLIDQLARKRNHIERPTLNACVDVHGGMVGQAENDVHPS